jgi:Delta3-Delta2-enoyl-CoA isomerase
MSAITLEHRGHIAIITLNNPDKLNALSSDDYFLLAQLMRNVARRDEVYITVLSGKGRFFSA